MENIQLTSQHELIGIVRDGEDVGWGLLALLASVGRHHLCIVHWQPLIGVDGDAEEARVSLHHKGRKEYNYFMRTLIQFLKILTTCVNRDHENKLT